MKTNEIGYLDKGMAACMIVNKLTVGVQMGSPGVETEVAV